MKWTPKLIEALHFKDEEDGVFWMSYDDFINNFRSIYLSIKLDDKYHYQIDGVFELNENDGASPFANGETDGTHLTQYILRAKSTSSQPLLHCIFEKTGGLCNAGVVLHYNKGEKVKYCYSGDKYQQFPMASSSPLMSFQFLFDEPQNPLNLLVF